MNTIQKHRLFSVLFVSLSCQTQDPKTLYVLRRDFPPEDSVRYCSGLGTWIVEVKNKELFYEKLKISDFDTVVWVEQILFFAEIKRVPVNNIVLGDSTNKALFFSFCSPPEIGEGQILEIFQQAGF